MKTIRIGVFETNSSSVHTFTMVEESVYDAWRLGEYLYHVNKEELVRTEDARTSEEYLKDDYLSYDEYNEHVNEYPYTEYYYKRNVEGKDYIIFGYCGYDG